MSANNSFAMFCFVNHTVRPTFTFLKFEFTYFIAIPKFFS